MPYSDLIMQYFNQPTHAGVLNADDRTVGSALVHSKETGRAIEIFIQIDTHQNIVKARFKAQGCAVTIATAAFSADYLHGKTLAEASNCKAMMIADHLKIPKSKHHCALMAEQAIKMAVKSVQLK